MDNSTDNTTTYEITKLAEKWCEYINLIYHKDRDLKFNIWVEWKYGKKPTYRSYHQGFIGGIFEGEDRETIEEAEKDLLQNIKTMISDQKMVAEEVLANPANYEEELVKQAKQYDDIFAGTV